MVEIGINRSTRLEWIGGQSSQLVARAVIAVSWMTSWYNRSAITGITEKRVPKDLNKQNERYGRDFLSF